MCHWLNKKPDSPQGAQDGDLPGGGQTSLAARLWMSWVRLRSLTFDSMISVGDRSPDCASWPYLRTCRRDGSWFSSYEDSECPPLAGSEQRRSICITCFSGKDFRWVDSNGLGIAHHSHYPATVHPSRNLYRRLMMVKLPGTPLNTHSSCQMVEIPGQLGVCLFT